MKEDPHALGKKSLCTFLFSWWDTQKDTLFIGIAYKLTNYPNQMKRGTCTQWWESTLCHTLKDSWDCTICWVIPTMKCKHWKETLERYDFENMTSRCDDLTLVLCSIIIVGHLTFLNAKDHNIKFLIFGTSFCSHLYSK